MATERKRRTVEDILTDSRKFHHSGGKSLKDRIGWWESIQHPESDDSQKFQERARYVVEGSTSNSKQYPGAKQKAEQVLDRYAQETHDVIDSEDKLAEIFETYVDTLLQHDMGKEGYQKFMGHLQKDARKKGKVLTPKDIRELKGQFVGEKYLRTQEGALNILSDQYLKKLKGKKKHEILGELGGISNLTQRGYVSHLKTKALEGLFDDHKDRVPMAEYMDNAFAERGQTHEKTHIFRTVRDQLSHYESLLHGDSDELKKQGYKALPLKKGNEKK